MSARYVDSTYEMLACDLPQMDALAPSDLPSAWVSIAGPSTLAFAIEDDHRPVVAAAAPAPRGNQAKTHRVVNATPLSPPTAMLWIRRPAAAAGTPLDATLRTPAHESSAGDEYHLRLDAVKGANDAQLLKRWLAAFGRYLSSREGAFYQFARYRVTEPLGAAARPEIDRYGRPRSGSNDLQDLMATMTGQARLQEALEADRDLWVALSSRRRSVAIESVKPPELPTHPYAEMLARLGKRVPDEPLAAAIPAEFYYLRARSLTALLDLLDRGELWAEPAAQVVDGQSRDAALSERYETALGLRRTKLTRVLGPDVVGEVALTGSDPYLREGSDVTLVFRVKNRPLFEAALGQGLAERSRGHGELKTSASQRATGATLIVSPDGAVHRVRASSGDLEIVSNSENAVVRVLAAIGKTRPSLASEPDFRYMLARDGSVPDDVLAYIGDRFVSAVVSPAQKIAEARRQIAVAELAKPGYAALLYGWLNGRAPANADELVKSGLLHKDELAHADGSPISWSPGSFARSNWGTIASQTPLIELPAVDKVTPEEASAYSSFALDYRSEWSEHVDPIAARLHFGAAKEPRLTARVRVLPVSHNRDLRELMSMVGQAKLRFAPLGRGVRAALGVGRDADLRRQASDAVHAFGRTLEIDWLGDWAMLGIDDTAAVARVAGESADIPPLMLGQRERGSHDEFRMLTELPLYAGVAIRHSAAATVALTALRHEGEGMLSWDKAEEYRKVAVWKVCEAQRSDTAQRSPCLYYALTGSALYAAFTPAQIHRLVDGELDGSGPSAPSASDPGSQFVFDLAPRRGGGIYTVIAWLSEAALLQDANGSRDTAEALMRGAPELASQPDRLRVLATATFGGMPVTVDGKLYELRADGIADPVWGTLHRPSWAPLPIAGSPVQRLLDGVPRFRSRMGFDSEPAGPANAQPLSLELVLEVE